MVAAEGMGLYSPIGAFPLFGPQDPCLDLAKYLQFLVLGTQVCVFILELLEPIQLQQLITLETGESLIEGPFSLSSDGVHNTGHALHTASLTRS
jgi:hypothetical protein